MNHPTEDASSVPRQVMDYINTPPDTVDKLHRAQEMMSMVQDLETAIKDHRRKLMVALYQQDGWTMTKIASELGLSNGRVRQIIREYESPERPGAMEHNITVAAAKATHKDEQQRARAIYRSVRTIKGIDGLPVERWEQYTGIPAGIWQQILPLGNH